MDAVTVEWQSFHDDSFHRRLAQTAEDAVTILRKLDTAANVGPVLVTFYRDPDGPNLVVSAGSEQAVLSYNESADPPYHVSLGDDTAEGVTDFAHGGQSTEIPRRNLIPKDVALVALAEFCRTLERPPGVDWEEV